MARILLPSELEGIEVGDLFWMNFVNELKFKSSQEVCGGSHLIVLWIVVFVASSLELWDSQRLSTRGELVRSMPRYGTSFFDFRLPHLPWQRPCTDLNDFLNRRFTSTLTRLPLSTHKFYYDMNLESLVYGSVDRRIRGERQ